MSIDYTSNNKGDITHDGKKIHLTEAAYAENYGITYGDNPDGGVRYFAHGVDDSGTRFLVVWDTTEEWDARDPEDFDGDAQYACDWGNPVEIREVE